MKHVNSAKHKGFFKPLISSRSVQAAMMVLNPGQSSSDKSENEHPLAEQWLFVIAGTGRAKFAGRSIKLSTGSLLLIEKGESHQITNTGRGVMTTINFYAPPAYESNGRPKGAATDV